MPVHNIQSIEDFDAALAQNKAVAVDCYATWCAPCKVIAPVFAHSSELDKFENIKFLKLDVDELPDLSERLGIRAMPTFVLFVNGEKVDELQGADQPGLITLLEKGVQ